MHTSKLLLSALMLTLPILGGCKTTTPQQTASNEICQANNPNPDYQVTLYFGRNISATDTQPAGKVTDEQWLAFAQEVITAAFPGFTVFDATGFWRKEQEQSKIVTIIVKQQDIAKARAVAKSYAEQFSQFSVLLTQSPLGGCEFVGASASLR